MKKVSISLPVILLIIFAATGVLATAYIIASMIGPNYDEEYEQRIKVGEFKKPLVELSKRENLSAPKITELEDEPRRNEPESFNSLKEIAEYSIVQSKAYNLHAPLFTSNYPEIEIHVGDSIFGVTIIDGEIEITEGSLKGEDLAIYTTAEEVDKIVEDLFYAKMSYENGDTSIKIKASTTELALKGYLSLYNEIIK